MKTLQLETISKLTHIALNRGLPFLAAVSSMSADKLQLAMNGGELEDADASKVEAWVHERVSTTIPVSKVRLDPISNK